MFSACTLASEYSFYKRSFSYIIIIIIYNFHLNNDVFNHKAIGTPEVIISDMQLLRSNEAKQSGNYKTFYLRAPLN